MKAELNNIIKLINEEFELDLQNRKGQKRYEVYPLKLYCKLAKTHFPKVSYARIARTIKVDHATVMHHIKTFDVVYAEHKMFYNNYIKSNNVNAPIYDIPSNVVDNSLVNHHSLQLKEINALIHNLTEDELLSLKENKIIPHLKMLKTHKL